MFDNVVDSEEIAPDEGFPDVVVVVVVSPKVEVYDIDCEPFDDDTTDDVSDEDPLIQGEAGVEEDEDEEGDIDGEEH